MKQISITISKESVYNDAERRTAYIGAKSEDEAAFTRTALTDADKDELDAYWNMAEPLLSTSFGKWLLEHTSDGDSCTFTLKVADAIGANAQAEIEGCAHAFMVDLILGKWCTVIAPDKVEFYINEATAHIKNLQTALLNRQRPTR